VTQVGGLECLSRLSNRSCHTELTGDQEEKVPLLSYGSYFSLYTRTPLFRINWDGEPSGYTENPDNLIFL